FRRGGEKRFFVMAVTRPSPRCPLWAAAAVSWRTVVCYCRGGSAQGAPAPTEIQNDSDLASTGREKMSDANRPLFLRIALIVIGLTFIFGIYTLGVLWPWGWAWGQGHSHYLMMIIGVYATLGVFLLLAARNPYAHTSLIWFTVWSSVVHAVIMGVQAV